MNTKETKLKIIQAGQRAVEELIKVATQDRDWETELKRISNSEVKRTSN